MDRELSQDVRLAQDHRDTWAESLIQIERKRRRAGLGMERVLEEKEVIHDKAKREWVETSIALERERVRRGAKRSWESLRAEAPADGMVSSQVPRLVVLLGDQDVRNFGAWVRMQWGERHSVFCGPRERRTFPQVYIWSTHREEAFRPYLRVIHYLTPLD